VVAHPAVDAWSLGVLAIELFTNGVALDLMQGKEKVCSQLDTFSHSCCSAEQSAE
jgi:hypothetical protein